VLTRMAEVLRVEVEELTGPGGGSFGVPLVYLAQIVQVSALLYLAGNGGQVPVTAGCAATSLRPAAAWPAGRRYGMNCAAGQGFGFTELAIRVREGDARITSSGNVA
jgi:hypothetical protein